MPVPFCGRDGQMAALSEHLDRARGGAGTVVLVEGDAGMGKAGFSTKRGRWRGAEVSGLGSARLILATAWSN